MLYKTKKIKKSILSGFTLLEILIVIALISIVMTIVFTLVNPADKINSAYDATQKTDTQTIRKAIEQYYIDNLSYTSLGIKSEKTEICDTRFNSYSEVTESNLDCSGLINLSNLVPLYVVGIPTNRKKDIAMKSSKISDSSSGYEVSLIDGKIDVTATDIKTAPANISINRDYNFKDVTSSVYLLAFLVILIVGIASFFIIKSNSRNNV